MKFETLFLRGLFGACVLACGLTLLAMVMAKPASAVPSAGHTVAAVAASATGHARTAG
jgi:hypothetical protein